MRNATTASFHAERARESARRRAMTLVEALMSIVLVGGLVLIALSTVGSATVAQTRTGDSGRGQLLALALMSEIMKTSYADPESPGSVFGPEPDETAGPRNLFDDVDDFQDWSETTLTDANGVKIPDLPSGWARSVHIQYANPATLGACSASDSGIKRITVLVFYNDRLTAELTAVRTGDAVGPAVLCKALVRVAPTKVELEVQ